jgi:hypothetical protein
MTTHKFVKGVVIQNTVVTNLSSIGLNHTNHTTNSLSEKANEFDRIRWKFNFKGITRNILVL